MAQDNLDRIPDSTFLKIFSYLNAKEIVNVSGVCQLWFRVARDEQLWKRRFQIDFHIKDEPSERPESWLSEYKRLMDECPSVPLKKLQSHKEHVLHVCFSKDGSMLATCSKDATLKVWNTKNDWQLLHDKNLRQLLYWRHTLCSRFNENDRLLLVSGLRAGESASVPQNGIHGAGPNGAIGLGELAVFEFVKKPNRKDGTTEKDATKPQEPKEELVFRCRAINEPFDVYGCWYDKESILNGQSRRFNQTSTMSDMYFLHAASEQTTSTRLFQFYNPTGGVVRSLCVSSYDRRSSPERNLETKDKLLIFTTGRWMDTPHQIGVKLIRKERITGPLEAATRKLKASIDNAGASTSKPNKPSDKKPEPLKPVIKTEPKQEKSEKPKENEATAQKRDSDTEEKPSTSATSEKNEGNAKAKEPETSAANAQEEKQKESSSEEESDDEDSHPQMQQVQIRVHTFDRVDHVIDVHGRIMGLTLSPCQRYVFINVHPFVDIIASEEHIQPPPVLDHLEIRIIDLQTLTMLEDGFTNKGVNSNSSTASYEFFIDLDACNQYILTGGDGSQAYLWDRQHRCFVRALAHESGRQVHSVAFHPMDPTTCVTAAEDGSVTVWCSKAFERARKSNV